MAASAGGVAPAIPLGSRVSVPNSQPIHLFYRRYEGHAGCSRCLTTYAESPAVGQSGTSRKPVAGEVVIGSRLTDRLLRLSSNALLMLAPSLGRWTWKRRILRIDSLRPGKMGRHHPRCGYRQERWIRCGQAILHMRARQGSLRQAQSGCGPRESTGERQYSRVLFDAYS